LDNTIRSTDDIERYLHLPALVAIPEIKGIGRMIRRPKALASEGLLQLGQRSGSPELLLDPDNGNWLGEAYRQLRTLVLLSTAGRAPKTLLITSANQGEGKTTTAVNVAISLAQTGTRVLLIDGDLRRPRMQDIFGVDGERGLSHYLSSQMSTPELFDIIWHDKTTGLHVLQAGSLPPNPAELLGSERMRQLLRALESNFTHVVIDSPPVASVTDAVLVASMVDGVLMVVQQSVCSREVAERSRQMLQGVGAKIIGVVLNKTSSKRHKYYFSKYPSESPDTKKTPLTSPV
jgi:capsular exopolysaccharide synthesis family protein